MFTDQPLYRAGALEPIAGYSDALFLVDAGGPVTKYRDQGYSAFFGIQAIRPIFVGVHGVFMIWAHAAMPAGYGAAPAGMPIAALAAGGQQQYQAPVPLNMGSYGFVQARFTLETFALAGPSIDDLDLAIQFGQIADYSLPQITGKYNAVDQAQSSSDVIAGAVQGANKALPAVFPQANPWDLANLTELYWFENNPPSFTLNNNGVVSTAGAVGLRLKGFRYMLIPLIPDPKTWSPQFVAGAWRNAPPGVRVVAVPTVPPTGTTTY
jgi:hypothetical protein